MEKVLYLEKEKSITFTGHRIIPFIRQEEVRTQLTTVVALAYKSGITCFYCGCLCKALHNMPYVH